MATKHKLKAPKVEPFKKVQISDLVALSERASTMVADVKESIMLPNSTKTAPDFSMAQLAALCGVDRGNLQYRLGTEDLPQGTVNDSGSRRYFTLKESIRCIQEFRTEWLKPKTKQACVIAVANFKGGVAKTTTAMSLAQGLSLRGHRVLTIDCDAQGSLTALFGISGDTDVDDEKTLYPIALGIESSVTPAIQKTYWENVDLIAASPALFNAEFVLPARQLKEPTFEFWNVLNYAIEDARHDYDVIIIDTSPSLSYLTINAIMAADGLLMPLPPSGLDFASSAQFWSLVGDLTSNLVREKGVEKTFDFLHVLLSRVDSSDASSLVVSTWIAATYKDKLLPVEIPKTAVTSSTSAEFGTVYDVMKYDGNHRTLKRARDAYDRVSDMLETSIRMFWAGQE